MTEPRQRIKHIPVVVADVVQETADTVTLLLDAGDDPRDYKAGQYVSIDPHQVPAIKGYAVRMLRSPEQAEEIYVVRGEVIRRAPFERAYAISVYPDVVPSSAP